MTEQNNVRYSEGSPWFWKIFGGAIFSLVSVLLIGYVSQINSNFDRAFIDLRNDVRDLHRQMDSNKEKLTTLEQNSCKSSTIQTAIEDQKQKCAAQETNIVALKEDVKRLREWNKELSKQVADLREKLAAMSAKKTDK